MKKNSKIFFKSCENMDRVKSQSVDMVVTSPPYWDLKDYESDDQIGYKENYDEYMLRIENVWKESVRCLKKDGVFIININSKSDQGSLKLIPDDFIIQLKKYHYELRDILYWHKSSAIPQVNNFGDHFEYFLIFTKETSIKINKKNFFDYKMPNINQTNLWNVKKKFGSVGKKYMIHPAVYPVEFIERLILIFTEEKDLVLDPFLGSGTTLIASILQKRLCYGFELNNSEYKKLIFNRLDEYNIDLSTIDIFS